MTSVKEQSSNLSHRGARYATPNNKNPLLDILRDAWHPSSNPTGYLSLGVAENTLMHQELISQIESTFNIDSHALSYGDSFSGIHRLRGVLAEFLNSYFKPYRPILPRHLLVTSGVSAAIEACSFSMCDPGDGVLLARPFYKAFPYNLSNRAGLLPVFVSFGDADQFALEGVAAYEKAFIEARDRGISVKALLLCSPHNPLGLCYSREVVQEYMRFCHRYDLHLISDEIYGLSVRDNPEMRHATLFHSVLSINPKNLIDPALVHAIWGMSKDFGVNGIRLGCIVSQSNSDLLQAVATNSIFTCPSSLADRVAVSILSNADFVSTFIKTSQARLSARYYQTCEFLKQHGIPYRASNAGLFVWADLFGYWSPRLGISVNDMDALEGVLEVRKWLEKRLDSALLSEKVYVAAGGTLGNDEAGWFRITFAHGAEYLNEGLRRILKTLAKFDGQLDVSFLS